MISALQPAKPFKILQLKRVFRRIVDFFIFLCLSLILLQTCWCCPVLFCLSKPLCYSYVWSTVWHVLTSHILTLSLCLDLLVVLIFRLLGSLLLWVWEAKYYSCRSAETVICFFLSPGSHASHLSSFCLVFLLHNLKSSCPSLCSCLRPPSSLSHAFLASLFSLPFTPSQDKQPLFRGMSAICSKKLTSFWTPFRSGSPKGGKITNLVLFHNLPLCFSFFLVYAALFSPPTLSRLVHLSLEPEWFQDVWVSTPCHLYVWPFVPPSPTSLTIQSPRIPVLFVKADLFSFGNFHHSPLTNTRGENWAAVLIALGSPVSSTFGNRAQTHNTHFSDSAAKRSHFGICLFGKAFIV